MELLIFGKSGTKIILYPTRTARFYDYEDWGLIEIFREPIEKGDIQIYCTDSIDQESFYCFWCEPQGRIQRHLQFENYLVNELLPFTRSKNPNPSTISMGCSMGAYHAVNIAFKYPYHFNKVIGLSGRYDLTVPAGVFKDLLDGYYDENVYFNMPNHYLVNIDNPHLLDALRKLEIVLVIGKEDVFIKSNCDLSEVLWMKNIPHQLHLWEGEAHKVRYWKEMIRNII